MGNSMIRINGRIWCDKCKSIEEREGLIDRAKSYCISCYLMKFPKFVETKYYKENFLK